MGKIKTSVWGKVCAAALFASIALSGEISGFDVQASGISGLQSQLAQLQQENAARDKQIGELGADIDDNEKAMNLISAQKATNRGEMQIRNASFAEHREAV